MAGDLWTDEMTAIAAGMKRAGLSAKTIAKRLGVTPDAVACKAKRIGARANLDGKSRRRDMGIRAIGEPANFDDVQEM